MRTLINARQFGRVADYIADGTSRPGIEIAIDGMASEYRALGDLYMGSTVLSRADNAWRLAQEEIFGPVIVAIPWTRDEEVFTAIKQAHSLVHRRLRDTDRLPDFGLGADQVARPQATALYLMFNVSDAEILVLRHKVAVLRRRVARHRASAYDASCSASMRTRSRSSSDSSMTNGRSSPARTGGTRSSR